MTWFEEKIEKWKRNLKTFSNEIITEKVMLGNESLLSSNEEERAKWIECALNRMSEFIPDISVRKKIMSSCSCVFTDEFGDEIILELRQEYKKRGKIEDVITRMQDYPDKFAFTIYEDGVIKEKRKPRDPESWAAAKTLKEKIMAACFCPLARSGKVPFPKPFCSCSAGWYAGIWEGILEKPVKAEVIKSLLYGDDSCKFEIIPSV
ncbi:hypothetical protein JXA84_03360 [candidate division WOR-3 bacterium]|nr:hypothetical protein [candidate division WOR-3 bacterium]